MKVPTNDKEDNGSVENNFDAEVEPNSLNGDNDNLNINQSETPDNGDDEQFNFDNDFDAGVEADEHSDPKKFIQQLTGKLSQKLREYNKNQEDSDLNKYVAGMIVVQAAKGLDQDGKDEIIDKINSSESDMDDMDTPEGNDGMEGFDEPTPEDDAKMKDELGIGGDDGGMNESRQTIDEVLNDVIYGGNEKENPSSNKITSKRSYRKKPFSNPNIK